MKKIIAILCIFAATVSLIWKVAERVFTTPPPAATRTIATVDPEGVQTTKTEPLGKVVTIARIRVAEGTQLIVKDGKIEPVGAGEVMTADQPLVDIINNALSWASLALLFIAGLFLYCFSGRGKKERAAPKPEPESAAAE